MERPKPGIILVEDTLTQAMLYQHMLEKGGFAVRLARSGKQALELIEKEKPIAILTDINMPEMSGYQLARTVKDSDTTRDIIVILLTTTLSRDAILDCINSGADEISLKGLNEADFVRLMDRSIDRRVEVANPPSILEANIVQGGLSVGVKCEATQNLRLLLSFYELFCTLHEN